MTRAKQAAGVAFNGDYCAFPPDVGRRRIAYVGLVVVVENRTRSQLFPHRVEFYIGVAECDGCAWRIVGAGSVWLGIPSNEMVTLTEKVSGVAFDCHRAAFVTGRNGWCRAAVSLVVVVRNPVSG